VQNEIVAIRGHLIDTATLSRVLNDVGEYGGDYVVERFDSVTGPTTRRTPGSTSRPSPRRPSSGS